MDNLDSPVEPQPVVVFGLPIVPWTLTRVIDEVERLIEAGRPRYFMTANLDTAMLANQLLEMRTAIAGASFVVADGMPLVWKSRLQGHRLPGRVTGSDLFPALCERAALRGYRVFFLGGPPGVGEVAAKKLCTRYPGLQIVGVESPPYRAPTPVEEVELLRRIRLLEPHLLFVAFGQPKGELWVHKHCSALGGTVFAQVGAALDFEAGRINRAPRWMQRIGMEWCYRLCNEPRRLSKRYARNALFMIKYTLQF